MFHIQNERLQVSILAKGAELNSLFNKRDALEYIWSGDPSFWPKKSPVLFPVVGALKENGYFHEGRLYQMGRHGFARDSTFSVINHTASSIRFSLTSNEQTRLVFPFSFQFDIEYSLHANSLQVMYAVTNSGSGNMYFSVGGHPAFRVPLVPDTSYTDYFLEFEEKEQASRWPVSKEGLIEPEPQPFLDNAGRVPLAKELFYQDALVLKHLASKRISLRSEKTPHGLHFHFPGFPFLGIWAAKDADFVCIEPWCGIADSINSNRQLAEKEGIIALAGGELFEITWNVEVF